MENSKKDLKETSCTICVMGEDRSAGCFQELQVMNCNVPFDIAKKMFELHNRYEDEYEDTSHLLYGAGYFAREKMDEQMQDGQSYAKGSKNPNFFGYVREMIEMEPERYKGVAKYIDAYFEETENSYASEYDEDEYYDLAMFFGHYKTDTKTYHWINKKKVSSKEWNEVSGDGFYHWCSVLELYSPNEEVPLVLDYEEGKFWGFFGYDDFEAYASITSEW